MSLMLASKNRSTLISKQAPVPRRKPVAPKEKVKTRPQPRTGISRWQRVKQMVDLTAKLFVLAALGYGGWHGYVFLTTSPYFAVDQVVYRGARVVTAADQARWSEIIAGKNIFQVDLKDLSHRITGHPWVRVVSTVRKFPRTIQVLLEERKPYARIKLDKTYLMDDYGVLISAARSGDKALPLITGAREPNPRVGSAIQVEGILPGLKAMSYLNALTFFHGDPIDHFQLKGFDKLVFTSRDQGLKVFMTVDRVEQGFRNFKILLSAVEISREGIRTIDLSFIDKVVISPQPDKQSGRLQHRT